MDTSVEFATVVKQCTGCTRIVDNHCRAYLDPEGKWRNGRCNHADIPQEVVSGPSGKKINPLKAAKGIKPEMAGRPVTQHRIGRNKGEGKKWYRTGAEAR